MKSIMTGFLRREVEPLVLVTEMKVPMSMTVTLSINSKSFELTAEDWNFILDAARKGMTPAPCMPAPCMPAPPPPPAPPAPPAPARKCLVDGCTNTTSQGKFNGDLCMPCHTMLIDGVVRSGHTFIHDLRDRLTKIVKIAT